MASNILGTLSLPSTSVNPTFNDILPITPSLSIFFKILFATSASL
jgi:hypothetical protein